MKNQRDQSQPVLSPKLYPVTKGFNQQLVLVGLLRFFISMDPLKGTSSTNVCVLVP